MRKKAKGNGTPLAWGAGRKAHGGGKERFFVMRDEIKAMTRER